MKLTAKTLLLVTPFNPALLQEDSCLSSFFYGNVRDGSVLNSVFIPTASCMGHFRSSLKTTELSGAPAPGRQLVWIEEESVEDSLRAQSLFHESPLDEITRRIALTAQGQRFDYAAQTPVSADTGSQSYDIHYRSSSGMLVSVDESTALTMDTLMPRFWKSAVLPPNPITHTPIPPAATQRVNHILLHLEFDPIVAQIVGNISIPQAKKDVRFLTGEDGKSGIVSRHSFTTGAITAAHWLKDTVEETGAHCRLMPFRTGFAPNVICRYDAIEDTNSTVIISGHYDSRGSFGSLRAPGGDDDGSGTTGVLSIARAIGRKGVKFLNNVELAFFAGEEQGLLGSYAYARELRAHDADIILMIQADMTAYRVPGEPLQLGLPAQIGSPEVTKLVQRVANIYSPELTVGYTSACCSDHQSFHEQGFPASQVFERAGPIADPMYHNSGDLSEREGYSFEQLFAIAKVQFGVLLHAAGYELD